MKVRDLVTRKKFPRYGVCEDGRAWYNRRDFWVTMHSRPNKAGRLVATFKDTKGRNYTVYIHAWVMAGFGEEKPHKGSVIKHRDGNFANNKIGNLYWGEKDSAPKNPVRGELHPKAALTEKAVRSMRNDFGKKRVSQIAKEQGVAQKTVRDIRDGKTWGWLK